MVADRLASAVLAGAVEGWVFGVGLIVAALAVLVWVWRRTRRPRRAVGRVSLVEVRRGPVEVASVVVPWRGGGHRGLPSRGR